jgi:hypothetical protein
MDLPQSRCADALSPILRPQPWYNQRVVLLRVPTVYTASATPTRWWSNRVGGVLFLYRLDASMASYRQIRADFDRDSIVVYQAYRKQIAGPAVKAGRFVEPFSWGRMTWIKPSFLWLMARSHWGQKAGQEHILAVRIKRSGWDRALSLGVLTSFEPTVHGDQTQWRSDFENAVVHVQWDPERTIHGKKLEHRSIQVGLSRQIIRKFTDQWILEIKDFTPLTRKIRSLYLSGNQRHAKEQLPKERVYPIQADTARRLGMDT